MLPSKLFKRAGQNKTLDLPSPAMSKLAVFKDGFWLCLLASVGIHAALFLFAPNPLKQTEKPPEMEVVGTVPVVTLPKQKVPTAPKVPQLPKVDTPITQPSENSQPGIIDIPEKTAPEKTVRDPIKSDPKPTKKPEAKEPKIDKTTSKSDELTSQQESQTEDPTKNQPSQDLNTKPNEATNSEPESDQTTSGATLSQDQFHREFGKIYAEYAIKYSRENVVQRIIPSPQETTVSQVSQTIEPGIEWIPPLEQPKSTDIKGKNTKVIVTLIVDPKGKIVKKWMFSSKNTNVDEIVKKTVKGYESKFMPLEGKIRIVTINYDFSG